MSFGVITSGVTEIVEWQIPDFLSLGEDRIESPRFTLDGCTWYLRAFPKGNYTSGWLSLYLFKDCPETATKMMTFSFGIKTVNGIFQEEIRFENPTFTETEPFCGKVEFFPLDDLEQRRQVYLSPSGTLTITCRVESDAPEEVVSQRRLLVELETLSSDFKDLLTSERKCDFTISVQGKEFRVHRSVLSARSPVFRAMLEHDTSEAKSGILSIPDCDPGSFGEFLNFLYAGKTEEMTYHTAYHLYATACKYNVQQLKSYCTDCLKQNLNSENVCDVVVLADRYDANELMSSAQDFFRKNMFRIFLTSQWKVMLKNHTSLVGKFLSEMSSAVLSGWDTFTPGKKAKI